MTFEFVDRLRSVDDANALGKFAERWYSNPSPNARKLLLAYLGRPLNAYRHEALIKRLFKRAEAAGDDAVMARFLVCFDRSIRRVIRQRRHREHAQLGSREEAERLVAQWKAQGFDEAYRWGRGKSMADSMSGELGPSPSSPPPAARPCPEVPWSLTPATTS